MPPDDSKLLEYLLGLLEEEARQEVESACRTSPEVAAELRELEEVLGRFASTSTPLEPSPRLRRHVLAALDPTSRFEGFVERLRVFFDLPEERIRSLLAAIDAAPEAPWSASGIPHTLILRLPGGPRVAAASDCGIVHMAPGAIFPPHRHRGDEWAFILQGSAAEPTGRSMAAGDIVHMAAGTTHTFRITSEVPCIFAVVLYAGLEFLR
jgi:anti-sigma factor ChrR (cupin superfamily)